MISDRIPSAKLISLILMRINDLNETRVSMKVPFVIRPSHNKPHLDAVFTCTDEIQQPIEARESVNLPAVIISVFIDCIVPYYGYYY